MLQTFADFSPNPSLLKWLFFCLYEKVDWQLSQLFQWSHFKSQEVAWAIRAVVLNQNPDSNPKIGRLS